MLMVFPLSAVLDSLCFSPNRSEKEDSSSLIGVLLLVS